MYLLINFFTSPKLNMWHLKEISFQYSTLIQHKFRVDRQLQKTSNSIQTCNEFCQEKFWLFTIYALSFDQVRYVLKVQIRWWNVQVQPLQKKEKILYSFLYRIPKTYYCISKYSSYVLGHKYKVHWIICKADLSLKYTGGINNI